MSAGADAGTLDGAVAVDRELLEDFRPRAFENGEWVSLRECVNFSKSGMKSGNDPVFVSVTPNGLRSQVTEFLSTKGRNSYEEPLGRRLSYRPMDQRLFYDDLLLLNRPGPELQRAWGVENVGLYAMPFKTGSGPATWVHRWLPDYHAFSGRGGYAFPLYDRRVGPDATNLNPALVAALGGIYGQPTITPPDIFDAILALLSATSYTRRFAEDLEDVFPHVPFPAIRAVFERAVTVGRDIRAVQTFARAPQTRFRPLAFFRLASDLTPGEPLGAVAAPVEGAIILCADGSGRVTGVPAAVWSFAVSGYRVLPRWIEGRRGLPAEQVWPELRDVAARIAELIHRFDEADLVLTDTLADTLTREELGFAPAASASTRGDE